MAHHVLSGIPLAVRCPCSNALFFVMVLAKTNLRVTVPLAVLAAQRSLWGRSVDEAFEVDKRKKEPLGLTAYMHGVKIPIGHRDLFGGPVFLP